MATPRMGSLRATMAEMPLALQCALAPHVEALRNGKVEYGEPCYRHVYRQPGRDFGHKHHGWQVILSLEGNVRRVAHAREAPLAALVAAAARLDPALRDQATVGAWVASMVEGGEPAAAAWLARVDLTRTPKAKVCKGRPRGRG